MVVLVQTTVQSDVSWRVGQGRQRSAHLQVHEHVQHCPVEVVARGQACAVVRVGADHRPGFQGLALGMYRAGQAVLTQPAQLLDAILHRLVAKHFYIALSVAPGRGMSRDHAREGQGCD
jgi:hypothetical protein